MTKPNIYYFEGSISTPFNSLPFNNTMYILKLNLDQVLTGIDGAVFKEEKQYYTVATNSYIGNKIIKLFNLPKNRIQKVDKSLRFSIIEYIKKHGSIYGGYSDRGVILK